MVGSKAKIIFSLALILSLNNLVFLPFASYAQFVSRLSAEEAISLSDGDLVRGEDGIKVYIIKGEYKRYIYNPKVFNMYGHLRWENIHEVEDAVLDLYTTSDLYRVSGEGRVYIVGELGVKRWIEDRTTFDIFKFSPNQIFEINKSEAEVYAEKPRLNQTEAGHLVRSAKAEFGEVSANKLIEKVQEVALRPYGATKIISLSQTPTQPATQQSASSTAQQDTTQQEISSGLLPSGGGASSTSGSDTISPSAITSLSVSNSVPSAITITWTAPGDDASSGTATRYDVRYSTATITNSNWSSATQATAEPAPQVAGSSQTMTISGLNSATTYYFAIKTSDEASNESGLSNVVSILTYSSCRTGTIALGSQTYSARSSGQPQIQGANMNPLYIESGTVQTITVTARDTNGNPITSMTATITTDTGATTITLSQNSGTATAGTWQGSWTSASTPCTIYEIKVTATSSSGVSNVTLAFL